MLFGKRKKEKLHKGDIFLAKGIYLTKPVMDNGHIVMNCFWRSLIVCLLTFGSVGGFLSAFQIQYNVFLVLTFYLLLSTFFSFLYASSKMIFRDLGYIVFFIIFLGAIYVWRIYANSGFYAVMNRILLRAQYFFDLSGIQEYEVQINNEYLTVAIVAIFIGMVMIIVLNIWMYSTMSLGWTILFTFPILLVPLYMKETPDLLYCLALCIGYLAVMVFKGNGHFVVFAWDTPFRVKGIKKDRVTYTQDAGVFRQVILTLGIVFFCMVLLVQLIIPMATFDGYFEKDKLRNKTKDTIGNFVLLGFEGLYNRYAATGGLSGGKLGGVATVRADYRTDLVVTYTPYSTEPVYLKGYTGGRYGDNQWESIYNDELQDRGMNVPRMKPFESWSDKEIFEEESLKREALDLEEANVSDNEYAADGIMDIRNEGADSAYLYYPYYTMFDNYGIYNNHSMLTTSQGIPKFETKSYHYYPKLDWQKEALDKRPCDIDTSMVNEVFLEVPEKNQEVIANECERIGLNDTMTEEEIIASVVTYFQDNIPYTLRPGASPRNADFINYFLTKNRKGYCAHFASAATLIFREMGIPARYVEGYAFSLENALTGKIDDTKDYYRYYQGYSTLGETAVLNVEVSDAMAHAWVEVYVDGFGWKQVEVTPASGVEESDEDDFWSAFARIADYDNDVNYDGTNNIVDIDLTKFTFIVFIVIGIIGFWIVLSVVRIIVRKIKRYTRCHQKDEMQAVIEQYRELCERIRVCDPSFKMCKSHREQLVYMSENYEMDINVEIITEILERISFSTQTAQVNELEIVTQTMVETNQKMRKYVTWKNRIKLMMR